MHGARLHFNQEILFEIVVFRHADVVSGTVSGAGDFVAWKLSRMPEFQVPHSPQRMPNQPSSLKPGDINVCVTSLWADCRKRKVDAVLVYRYDRFARSLRQLVNALEEFRALGIDFVSLHEGVDTSTPNGRLVFGIFASIAEFERELIRGRVISGLAAARAPGARLGRPRTSVDATQIARLRATGAPWRQISEQLGVGVGTACRAFHSLPKTP